MTKKAIALGTFDGIHKGHRAVLDLCNGYELTVLTFRIPPKSIKEGTNELIMLPCDRKEKLLTLGADFVDFLDFDSVKDISADEFLSYIKKKYNPDLICCGFNFRFGKSAKGNTDTIKEFCEKNSIDFALASPVYESEELISSTLLRKQIKNGNIDVANNQIFGGFGFTSEVVDGDKRGRELGFPTINQPFPKELVLPKFGVYASKMKINGAIYKGVTNLGVRPTFKTDEVFCETYLFDFSGEVYGENVTLSLEKFVREEKKFSSVSELKKAISKDIISIKEYWGLN